MKIGPVIATLAALSACTVPTLAQAVNPREDAIMLLTERAKYGALNVLKANPTYSPVQACKLAAMNDFNFAVDFLQNIYTYTSSNVLGYRDNDIQRVVSGCVKKVNDLRAKKAGLNNTTSLTRLAENVKFIAKG